MSTEVEITSRIKLQDLVLSEGNIRFVYNIFPKDRDDVCINNEPVVREIYLTDLLERKRGWAAQQMKKKIDDTTPDNVFEDLDHYIESNDPLFVKKRELESMAMDLLKELLK